VDINERNAMVKEAAPKVEELRKEISKKIVGQNYMIDRILIGILTGGHILLEGVPGLAKTKTVSTIAELIGAGFKRIQFTPDLLPADIIGTEIYNHSTAGFITKKGPIFSNIILADEINRAPAKVQSALLEAMQEKQVTINGESYKLEEPFLVLATQNPIEQEGTYQLPEAQQDRFMMKLRIEYSTKEEEKRIVELVTEGKELDIKLEQKLSKDDIDYLRKCTNSVYVDERIKNYILDIVFKTREKSQYIMCGASPRASINLVLAAKGKAFLEGRGYVLPDDVKSVVYDVLRHRILLTYEAEAEDMTQENIISDILKSVDIP
jgi:MoxR-like ATPase